MKYIFFGSPEFAAIVLEKLISSGFMPSAVVCNPDRPVGRKKILTPPPTKLLAQQFRIPVLQPEVLSISNLKFPISKPDFFVVAAYAKIIPKSIIELPRLGTIGVHPSLLPRHRGASPIQSAILSGDEETGVTLYLMDEKVDHGPVLALRELEFPISPSTGSGSRGDSRDNFQFPNLLQKLAELAGELLVETLPRFLAGEIIPQPQNESQATFTKKFTSDDGHIELSDLEKVLSGADSNLVEFIDRKIRALNPEPGVWTIKNGKRMKLLEAEIVGEKLRLKVVQMEGKRPQSWTYNL